MQIMIVSYGIAEYDGRLQELVHVAEKLGSVHLCCCTKNHTADLFNIDGDYLSAKTYLGFCRYVLKRAAQCPYDIILSDNLFSAFPVLLLRLRKRPRYLVQDVRELYFPDELKGKGKLFAKAERMLMKKADVILCANEERAQIMHQQFGLAKQPLVFENIRFLPECSNAEALANKYRGVFKYQFNLISTSGLFMARDTDKLIASMKELDDRFGLFFVGNSSSQEIEKMDEIMKANNIKNIHLLGKVPMEELTYLVSQCQIGVVHYHKKNLNNKFCASGKIYEFLHEGLPIVTTENPPLKKMCNTHGIGIADDGFSHGILTIAKSYGAYCQRVREFVANVSVDAYNGNIAQHILNELEGRHS